VIRPERIDSAAAVQLIDELQQDLTARYGGPDETPLTVEQFTPPAGLFVVAYLDERPVGCAGIKASLPGTFDLKRTYVRPDARGRGVARALLAELERAAVELGGSRVRLETGDQQPEAVALYASAGYLRIPGFGIYADEPGNICLAKELA
jgi:GNAT superfamily N-acetyltransferase